MGDAARLIGHAAGEAFQKVEMTTPLGWIDALPEEMVHDDGELATYKAAALFFTGQTDAAAACLAGIEGRLAAQPAPHSHGRVLALRARFSDLRDDAATVPLAQQTLELIGDGNPVFRILVLLPLGHALRYSSLPASAQVFRETLDLAQRIDYPLGVFAALVNLAFNIGDQGQLREAIALCQDALARYVDRRGRPLPIARQTGAERVAVLMAAVKAALQMRHGNLAAPVQRAETVDLAFVDAPPFWSGPCASPRPRVSSAPSWKRRPISRCSCLGCAPLRPGSWAACWRPWQCVVCSPPPSPAPSAPSAPPASPSRSASASSKCCG